MDHAVGSPDEVAPAIPAARVLAGKSRPLARNAPAWVMSVDRLSAKVGVVGVQGGIQGVKRERIEVSQFGKLNVYRPFGIRNGNPSTCLMMLDRMLEPSTGRSLEKWVLVEASHHRAIPFPASAVLSYAESVLVEELSDLRAIQRA